MRGTLSVISSESADRGTDAARRVRLRNEELDGEPALFIPRWTTMARVGRLILAAMAVGCLAGAALLAMAGEPGWAILLLPVGLVTGAFLVRGLSQTLLVGCRRSGPDLAGSGSNGVAQSVALRLPAVVPL
jgi:hypothetical protein